MVNEYMDDDGMLWIDIPNTRQGTPVFSTREAFLNALAECVNPMKNKNIIVEYSDTLKEFASKILENCKQFNKENLFEEITKLGEQVMELTEKISPILFEYQYYLIISQKDKELFDELKDILIPNSAVEDYDDYFDIDDDCDKEFYWFMSQDRDILSNQVIAKQLTNEEAKDFMELKQSADTIGYTDELAIKIQTYEAMASIRLAYKVIEGNI